MYVEPIGLEEFVSREEFSWVSDIIENHNVIRLRKNYHAIITINLIEFPDISTRLDILFEKAIQIFKSQYIDLNYLQGGFVIEGNDDLITFIIELTTENELFKIIVCESYE